MVITHIHARYERSYYLWFLSHNKIQGQPNALLSHLPPYKSRCSVCNNNDNNLPDKLSPLLPPIRLFSPQETLVVSLMVLNLVIYEILGRLDNVTSDMFVLQGASMSWRHRVASCNESFMSSCILWILDGAVAGSQRFLPEGLMVWEVTDVFSRRLWSPVCKFTELFIGLSQL